MLKKVNVDIEEWVDIRKRILTVFGTKKAISPVIL
jgi:hypothetical protein